MHIGGRILDEPTVSGHLFVAAKRTLTAPTALLYHLCTVVLVTYLPTLVTPVSSAARVFAVIFFWSDQHRHTRDSVSRIAMAPGSDRVAASIPHSYTALQLHSAVWWLQKACTFHTRPQSRSRVAEQVWDNTVLPNMRFPPSLAGEVEGLGARDAGSKTRSALWPAHSCKGIRTSSIISLRVYILS